MESVAVTKLVSSYLTTQAARRQHDKDSAELKKSEDTLKQSIIAIMKAGNGAMLGKDASRVTLTSKSKPVVDDWNQLYSYIRRNDAFELLHRRLTEAAVTEREEAGEVIPGISHFPIDDITITKE